MIKGFLLSLQFFSSIPIPGNIPFQKQTVRYAIFFQVLVGLIIGGGTALVFNLLFPIDPVIATFFALCTWVLLSGGLHLDGLSDCCDALAAHKDKEGTLEVMKDSRVGTFGAVALMLHLAAKALFLYHAPEHMLAILTACVSSRLICGLVIGFAKPAKKTGLGAYFHSTNPRFVMLVLNILFAMLLSLRHPSYLISYLVCGLAAILITSVARYKIGGVSGDVFGAIIETGEVVTLIALYGVNLWIF